jgi:DNA-binding CsgD family transcriptional regulator
MNNNFNIEDFFDLPCHVYLKDKHGKILVCNDSQVKNAGYSQVSDMVGLNDYDICENKSASIIRTNDLEVMKNKKPKIVMEVAELHNGIVSTAFSYKLPFYALGKTIGTFGLSFTQESQILFFMLHAHKKQSTDYRLSKREIECLYYLVKGKTAKEIARVLNLSPRTIEVNISKAKVKLHCNTRSQLINIAFNIQIIKNKLLYDIIN